MFRFVCACEPPLYFGSTLCAPRSECERLATYAQLSRQAAAMDVCGLLDLLVAQPGAPQQQLASQSGEEFRWARCSYTLQSESGHAWPPATMSSISGLRVQMAKDPPRLDGAFRWHKNCVLPRIHVALEGGGGSAELSSAAVLLSAVAVDVLTHTARSVGLDGECLRPLVNGACAFSSLSFKTTSYNLPGRPSLHLLATLLVRQGHESLGGGLHVACSTISPAITVDARKRQPKGGPVGSMGSPMGSSSMQPMAADKPGGPGSGASGAAASDAAADGGPSLMPFAPDLLERRLEKVEASRLETGGKEASRLAIDNSIDGLRNYLSALNIRNKCKHPLFLVLRFDTCIGLLYDSTQARDPADDDEAFYNMMACLSGNDRSPPTLMATGTPSSGFAPYVIAVKSSHQEGHACERSDCPVKLSAALSLPHTTTLPFSYTLLCETQVSALRRTYCRLYCKHASVGPRGAMSWQASSALPLRLMPPPPQVCTTCPMPHEQPEAAPAMAPAPATDLAIVEAQRHATALLATVRQMAQASVMAQASNQLTDESKDEFGCPEREWEEGLRILAEALTMHCSTRSAAEIIGFMNGAGTSGAVASAGKRQMLTHVTSTADSAGGALPTAWAHEVPPIATPARRPWIVGESGHDGDKDIRSVLA